MSSVQPHKRWAYIVGRFRISFPESTLLIEAAARDRALTYRAKDFKIFASHQAADRWKKYLPQYGGDVRDLSILRVPVE